MDFACKIDEFANMDEPQLSEEEDKKVIPVLEIFGPTLQGEGAMIGVQTFFVRLAACDYDCPQCIDETQRVLMADWSTKPIGQITIGDYVMGVTNSLNKFNKVIKPTKVLAVLDQGIKDVIKVTTVVDKANKMGDKKGPYKGVMSTSLKCTEDHPLLNVKWRTYWQPAGTCQDAVLRAVGMSVLDEIYWIGWLHGALQGDGNIHKFQGNYWRMKLSCIDVEIRDKAFEIISLLGAKNPRKIYHDGGNGKKLLPGVEVTEHLWVEKLKQDITKGSNEPNYRRGWLAGFYDTDGYLDDSKSIAVRISQSHSANKDKLDRCLEYANSLGFSVNMQQFDDIQTGKGITSMSVVIISHCMEFFTTCPGVLSRKRPTEIPIGKMPRAPVESITPAGKSHVFDITTETGNFVCEGIVVHNCDTRYAIEPAQFKSIVQRLTQEELAHAILNKAAEALGNVSWVTFSGGNPALWDLRKVVRTLHHKGFKVAVETQGSIWKPWLNHVDVLTISPKGPGMGVSPEKSKTDVINFLDNFLDYEKAERGYNPHRVVLKIPIFNSDDLDFAEQFADMFPALPLYLSTGNTLIDLAKDSMPYSNWDLRENGMKQLIAIAEQVYKRPGLDRAIILPQLHVLMYGNRREV